jgi:hypothetical protein
MRRFVLCAIGLAGAIAAQTPVSPNNYTVVEMNALGGHAEDFTIYRSGNKALIRGKTFVSYYDLATRRAVVWDPTTPAASCSDATFAGDWGDPWDFSAATLPQLAEKKARETGVDTLIGRSAKVMEVTLPQGVMKIWLEAKSNLILKSQIAPIGSPPITMVEIKSISLDPPPATVFQLPAGCKTTVTPR